MMVKTICNEELDALFGDVIPMEKQTFLELMTEYRIKVQDELCRHNQELNKISEWFENRVSELVKGEKDGNRD